MSANSIISCVTDILLALFAVYLFFYYFDIFLIRKKRRALTVMGTVVFAAWQIEISNGKILPAYANISITIITVLLVVELIYKGKFWNKCIFAICIFRKNRALAPHERSAVPLGTDHCPVG